MIHERGVKSEIRALTDCSGFHVGEVMRLTAE